MRVDCDDCGKIVEEKDLVQGPYDNLICKECYQAFGSVCEKCGHTLPICECVVSSEDQINVDNDDTPCNNSDNPIQSGGQE